MATSSSRHSGANGARSSDTTQEDEDVDLVVDGDENAQFGPSQYTEADVVTPRHEGTEREQKEREALREAVISPNGAPQPSQSSVEVKSEPVASPSSTCQTNNDEAAASSSTSDVTKSEDADNTPVLEALRGRIRELEAEMRGQAFKCLICMVSFSEEIYILYINYANFIEGLFSNYGKELQQL